MKTGLTIEESAKLIELGVDKKLASVKEFVPIHPEVLKGNAEYAKPWGWMPKFTLTDLLAILPKGIVHEGLWIKFRITSYIDEPWFAGYQNQVGQYVTPNEEPFSSEELIDSLYQLLIWTINNGYINLKTANK